MTAPCIEGGQPLTLSVAEQIAAQARCPSCGRVLKLRKNASGFAREVATLPRHNTKSYRMRS